MKRIPVSLCSLGIWQQVSQPWGDGAGSLGAQFTRASFSWRMLQLEKPDSGRLGMANHWCCTILSCVGQLCVNGPQIGSFWCLMATCDVDNLVSGDRFFLSYCFV
ncbi:hypothetical protein BS78_09G074600 [Paspalum vaginatum]|nr:hypothetical protein BS78_09G074600 [Paspalum vaginatum]